MFRRIMMYHVANLSGTAGEEEEDIAAAASGVLVLCHACALACLQKRSSESESTEKEDEEYTLHVGR
jgi:hypothetical protein